MFENYNFPFSQGKDTLNERAIFEFLILAALQLGLK